MGEPVPRAAQRHHAPRRAGGGQPGASARGLGAYRIGAGDGSATESGEWASGHNLADMARTLSVRGADGYALYRYASLYSGGEYAALMQAECAALAQANGIEQTEP